MMVSYRVANGPSDNAEPMSSIETEQFPPDLRPHLDAIANRLLTGHAAVMVGSGFSKNAARGSSGPAFADWTQLGDRFYDRLDTGLSGRSREYLSVPGLAHEVEASLGRSTLDEMLRDAIPDLYYEPSPLHVRLLDLPWSDVLTTNYDTLLERACRSVISQRFDIVASLQGLENSTRPRIIKLHGSFSCQSRLIVTDEDYRTYPQTFAPFVNTVRQALLENTLCLLGFSGDDPNFLQWIGWIHDNLGRVAGQKMYLIGALSLTRSQKMLLERRNIIPLDMSLCSDVGGDHYKGIERFLDYLHLRAGDKPLEWPAETGQVTFTETDDPIGAIQVWRSERRRYPGWVVLPEDCRDTLWSHTERWISRLPAVEALPAQLDLEFAFELTWRTEKCLIPLFDNHAEFVAQVLDRHWPAVASATDDHSTGSDVGVDEATDRQLTADEIRRKCHYLLLALLRYYREEGKAEEWEEVSRQIADAATDLSPELTAQFHYERAMFALFVLDLPQLMKELADWPTVDALPFWAAKKAALLAEVGVLDEAESCLQHALQTIRAKSNLKPTRGDFTLPSQESLLMLLLKTVRVRPPSVDRDRESSDQRRAFRDRWDALRRYKCDPWRELHLFRLDLARPPSDRPETTETPMFDLGRVTLSHHWGSNKEVLTAYQFLRYCEDAAIPFRTPLVHLAVDTATGALPRIARPSSHWALATLFRVGSTKAIEAIFDRPSLASIEPPTVDQFVTRYVAILRQALPSIEDAVRQGNRNFATRLATVIPEVLSRLCCKCSDSVRRELVVFLLDVYRSDSRGAYRGIRNLLERLLEASSLEEQADLVPQLLRFPILGNLTKLEQTELVNPFHFIRLPNPVVRPDAVPDTDLLDTFFTAAATDDPGVRRWTLTTLTALYDLGLLQAGRVTQLADVLWMQRGADGFPSNTNRYRHAFIALPHPPTIDPGELLREHIRTIRFPMQKDKTSITIGPRELEATVLCREIRASEIRLHADDVRAVAQRLVEWWDNDKLVFARAYGGTSLPTLHHDLRVLPSALMFTLGVLIARHTEALDSKDMRCTIRRVINETKAFEIPSLVLESGCASLLPELQEGVLRRIEGQLASPRRSSVLDALRSVEILSEKVAADGSATTRTKIDFTRGFTAVGEMIRWRAESALTDGLRTARYLLRKHPWAFVDEVERSLLSGLHHLILDTAVPSGVEARVVEDRERDDVRRRLFIRREAAALAYATFEHYQKQGTPIPDSVLAWETLCQSADEFAEIRCRWINAAG